MSFKVIEAQPTPNPNAMKYVLDREISDHPMSFFDPSSGREDPIASRIFEVAGVTSLLILKDFVTVSKDPKARWADITAKVKQVLASL